MIGVGESLGIMVGMGALGRQCATTEGPFHSTQGRRANNGVRDRLRDMMKADGRSGVSHGRVIRRRKWAWHSGNHAAGGLALMRWRVMAQSALPAVAVKTDGRGCDRTLASSSSCGS